MLVCLPPPEMAEVCPFYDLEKSPPASGQEGMVIKSNFDSLVERWSSSSSLRDSSPVAIDDSHYSPFEKVGTIRVLFRKATPLLSRYLDAASDD